MEKLCSVAGTCISLTSKIVKQYADFIPVIGQVAKGAVTLNTNKLHFGMLLKETGYAVDILNSFKKQIKYLEEIEKEVGFVVCDLETGRKFVKDFTELLSFYEMDTLNKTQQILSPDWYRQQLQIYLSNLMILTLTIQTTANAILSESAQISLIKDTEARAQAKRDLEERFSCSSGKKI